MNLNYDSFLNISQCLLCYVIRYIFKIYFITKEPIYFSKPEELPLFKQMQGWVCMSILVKLQTRKHKIKVLCAYIHIHTGLDQSPKGDIIICLEYNSLNGM